VGGLDLDSRNRSCALILRGGAFESTGWVILPAERGGHGKRGHAETGREGASQGHRREQVEVRACFLHIKYLHDSPAMQKVGRKPCGCKFSAKSE